MTRLEDAEQRMQQKWYELVQADLQGAPALTLERLYNAYMLAVESYNRCVEQQATPVPIHNKNVKRKAS